MSSLRQLIHQFQSGDHPPDSRGPGERRGGRDRRISERRNNVHPLESQANRLRFAAQAAGFGTYDLDCATGASLWSPELRAIAGLPQDKSLLSAEEAESVVHPDDRQRFLDKLQASLVSEGDGQFEDEYRLLRPDGTIRWVKTKGRTFFVGAGEARRPLAATGVVMDVTAGRSAERELAESREELAKLVDAAIDAIITIDDEQRIVRFNAAASRMFRWPAERALGAPLESIIPERFRKAHGRHVGNFAEGGVTARTMGLPGVFSGLRMDGDEFPIEASIAKVQTGGRQRMTVFLRDITDRVRAEAALRRSKEDLELAVRGADVGIWHWDLRTGQVECSERCRQLLGLPMGEPFDYERFLAVVHPDDRRRVEEALRRAMEEGVEYKVEKRIVWHDSSVRWIEGIARNYYEESSHQVLGMRGIVLDITERKRQEEGLRHSKENLETRVEERTTELMRANEALERSNLELQQFAFIAAHDLQTPLRSIAGFAQLLQKDYRGRLDIQADSWLDQLVRSAKRMHDIVHDILAYSRVESRGSAFLPVDFRQLFDDVAAVLSAPIRESGARVTRGDLPVVMGDRTQLAQVLQNLIDNGIKYRGPRSPRIHVAARQQGEEWLFSVSDNGIGIAEKHQEAIFDIFRRLHTQQEYPGSGIGLAICRRVIHRHGGRIWVESVPGQGSTFHFTLPARQEAAS